MLVLILDGQTALAGAREGIDLCIRVLIPSLFPFFVLSSLLTGTLIGQPMPILRPIGKSCGIPEGAESLLAVGLLGGYPVGAQSIGTAFRAGILKKADSERMLAFCNNAGPSFLFGILGPLFSELRTVWYLWLIHVISALLVGIVSAEKVTAAISSRRENITLTTALERSVKIMATVSGWVVIFRILLNFLDRWFLWLLPETARIFLTGILELSNGCVQLAAIKKEGLRFLIAGILLSLGGICVTMQTASVTPGLSLKKYTFGKLLQCCFSFFLCMLLQVHFPSGQRFRCSPLFFSCLLIIALILIGILRNYKKISRFPAAIGV